MVLRWSPTALLASWGCPCADSDFCPKVEEIRHNISKISGHVEEVKKNHSIILSAPNPEGSKWLTDFGAPFSGHLPTALHGGGWFAC